MFYLNYLSSAACSAIIGIIVTQPFDVIRARLMNSKHGSLSWQLFTDQIMQVGAKHRDSGRF